ncbi:MAG: S9 family peptidase, partial [Gammaproteobacteria bacterium]
MTLIPRRKLFGNPERAFALVSPDGRQIAGLAPVAGVMNIVVAPIAAADAVTPVTHETGRGISHCVWAFDGVSLLYRADRNGDENWHIYRVSSVDGEV